MKDLSIIIVSYNTKDLTLQAIKSVLAYTKLDFEVIVADNDSKDGSVEAIQKTFPGVEIIPNKNNLGFARAVNQAVSIAEGEKILLLNPDAWLIEAGGLEAMSEYLDQHPEVGIIGPRLVNPDGSWQPQHV